MKKLFKAIRQFDLDEVKMILEKTPEAVNSTVMPPPKKDIGQSPLQVAIKIGGFEIAYYLIENGADINFMEEEAEDITWRTPVLHDAIRTTLQSLCYSNYKTSDDGLELVKYLLERGTDTNQCDSRGINAWGTTVQEAEKIIESPEAYSKVQDFTKKRFRELLDLLIAFKVDNRIWLDKMPYGEKTNRQMYVADFVPDEDRCVHRTYRGKQYTQIIKGDEDRTARMRSIIKEYFPYQ